jgi:hypothetical protein
MKRILGFVEDPGAANFFLGLAPHLSAHYDFKLLATGSACSFLTDRWPVEDISSAESTQILTRYHPDLFLCGTAENPETMGLELILAFRQRQIPTVGLVDAFAHAAFRFRGRSSNPLWALPDYLLVPDTQTAQAFLTLGVPEERIAACGHPLYDVILAQRQQAIPRQERRHQLGWSIPADRQLWLFAAEIETGMDPAIPQKKYTLAGRNPDAGRTIRVLEALLESLTQTKLRSRVQLAVRLHPKNHRTEFRHLEHEIDFFSQSEPVWSVLQASDRVIGMTSFLLIEAYLLGLPVWSLLPHPDEAEWLSGQLGQEIPQTSYCEQIVARLPDFYAGHWPVLSVNSTYYQAGLRCLHQLQKWLSESQSPS